MAAVAADKEAIGATVLAIFSNANRAVVVACPPTRKSSVELLGTINPPAISENGERFVPVLSVPQVTTPVTVVFSVQPAVVYPANVIPFTAPLKPDKTTCPVVVPPSVRLLNEVVWTEFVLTMVKLPDIDAFPELSTLNLVTPLAEAAIKSPLFKLFTIKAALFAYPPFICSRAVGAVVPIPTLVPDEVASMIFPAALNLKSPKP
jgi:hypothetical protein